MVVCRGFALLDSAVSAALFGGEVGRGAPRRGLDVPISSTSKRDFRRHAESLAEQKTFGEAGVALTGRLFKAWHAFGQHRDRRRLRRALKPIRSELRKLLERAARKSARTRYHARFARNLLKIRPALFTFVDLEGVEPTNNAAERSLRGPVIHRKLSHGTRTDDGERFVERALSASVTCRLQHRSLFAYLAELLTATPAATRSPRSFKRPSAAGLNGYTFRRRCSSARSRPKWISCVLGVSCGGCPRC
ncbi:MAG: transposase [Actinobacteria bacterium]|nr:transposase [Actinomycetota bacterium]